MSSVNTEQESGIIQLAKALKCAQDSSKLKTAMIKNAAFEIPHKISLTRFELYPGITWCNNFQFGRFITHTRAFLGLL